MKERPDLEPGMDADEFEDWYWLHADLKQFAAALGIPGTGTKPQLSERLVTYLRTGDVLPSPTRRPRARMPDPLTPETVVGEGWRCSRDLRAYMVTRVGPDFTFNAAVRAFIGSQGVGLPLAELDAVWRSGRTYRPSSVDDIEPSLEFNRFRHEYRRLFPQADGDEIARQWEGWRETAVSERPRMEDLGA